jgi:hypothetical protein
MAVPSKNSQLDSKLEAAEIQTSYRAKPVDNSSKGSRPTTSNSIKRRQLREGQSPNTIDLENRVFELSQQLEEERGKVKNLHDKISDRQERYVKREQEYRRTISEFEKKLKGKAIGQQIPLNEVTSKNIEKMNSFHSDIIRNISTIQYKTTHILQDQEKEIVKQFNHLLNEKSRELAEERKKKIDGMGNLTEKEYQLYRELELRRTSVELLESKNKFLHKQNSELKIEYKSQESDKGMLELQLAELKKRSEKLKEDLNKVRAQANAQERFSPEPQNSSPEPYNRYHSKSERSGLQHSRSVADAQDQKYQKIINKLKRLHDIENKNLRAARTAYARELQKKSELERILRESVEDVKIEINRRRTEMRIRDGPSLPEEIEKIIDVLLSQERVLTLLYDKTFPPRPLAKDGFEENLDLKYSKKISSLDQKIEHLNSKYEEEASDQEDSVS